ncbi:gluconokinase [Cryobacterium sp. N19]|uniref:gluconokinase n=1 Tax=Cryobacterium sp. N19 TaxID=2048288 RepID=UPI001E436C7D|nr:gluconokinase, GntK/IdnK-type [Cryobacterium sp. N19]
MGLPPIVVMGVQGSGKSTIGEFLAERLGARFLDGDTLHPAANKAAMAAGNALQDEHRLPWLHEVGRCLAGDYPNGIVIACSALKRSYRDLLRDHAVDLFVVDPEGSIDLIAARLRARTHEFMPPALLQSQFDTLEVRTHDERGVTVDIVEPLGTIVERILAALAAETESGEAARVTH